MSNARVEWRGRNAFAEVAEALAIAPVDVCAAWSRTGEVTEVLYQRAGDATMIHAALARDDDGIFRRVRADEVTDLTVESMMRERP